MPKSTTNIAPDSREELNTDCMIEQTAPMGKANKLIRRCLLSRQNNKKPGSLYVIAQETINIMRSRRKDTVFLAIFIFSL